MDFLNVLAQIVVLLAIFLWTVLKAIWILMSFIWQMTRDYSPILAAHIWKMLKKVWFISRKYLTKLSVALSMATGFVLKWTSVGVRKVLALIREVTLSLVHLFNNARHSTDHQENTVEQKKTSTLHTTAQAIIPLTQNSLQSDARETLLRSSAVLPDELNPSFVISEQAGTQKSDLFEILKRFTYFQLHLKKVLDKVTLVFRYPVFSTSTTVIPVQAGIQFLKTITKVMLSLLAALTSAVLSVLKATTVFLNYLFALILIIFEVSKTTLFIGLERTSRWLQLSPTLISQFIKTQRRSERQLHREIKDLNTSKKSLVLSKISLAGMIISAAILVFIFFPDLVYAIVPLDTEPIQSAVNQSALGGKFSDGNLYAPVHLPEKNEYLPDGNWLVIPKIGVLTQINEDLTADHEEALKNGVWRVPEFADPTQGQNYPTILVAHKYGYLAWSNKFRHQNSFYNLEKLEVGDTFDIIWDHRKFTYEIYAGEEGKDITDYKADVVLYTCKYLNSPARIFRYARRVEW